MSDQDLQGLAQRLREYMKARGALGGLVPPVMREAADALERLRAPRGTCSSCRWEQIVAVGGTTLTRPRPVRQCANPKSLAYERQTTCQREVYGCTFYDPQPTATEGDKS